MQVSFLPNFGCDYAAIYTKKPVFSAFAKQKQGKRGFIMAKTAIYVRQSADRADSVSLETQEQLCRSDVPLGEEVTVYADRGFSGKNIKRPSLNTMLEDIRRGEIGRVLVYKLDRISRNLADFTDLLQIFSRHGVEFHSHTERFETGTPMGQAMQSLLMVFAQLERETISGRVRDAAFARAKIGFDTGGPPPIGFAKEPFLLMGKRTQYLVPDANAERIVALFTGYANASATLSEIAAQWNHAQFFTARGGKWSRGALCRILRNPVYVKADTAVYAYLTKLGAVLCIPDPLPQGHGVYLYADRRVQHNKLTDLHDTYAIAAPHKGLVSPDVWLACQQRMTKRRSARTLGMGERTWLSGSIFCKRCGSAVTAVQGRSALYLVCGGKKRGICGGVGATWRCDEAEQLIGGVLAEELRILSEQGIAEPCAQDITARQTVHNLQLRRTALMRALTEGSTETIAVLTEAITQIDARIASLAAKAENVSERRYNLHLPQWESLTTAQKKAIAKQLLCCAMVDENTIHIYFR